MSESTYELSRRRFLAASAGLALNPLQPNRRAARQATGVKIGEVTHDSALVWMRLTQAATRKRDGVTIKHRFHRVKGGFVSVAVTAAGGISTRHHDVNGKIVHEWNQP